MTYNQPSSIIIYEVAARPNGIAYLSRFVVHQVENDAEQELTALIQNSTWDKGAKAVPPLKSGSRFERSLDIEARPGRHLYAFHLNAVFKGKQDLFFVEDRPIAQFASDNTHIDGRIESAKCYGDSGDRKRWASFVFDTTFLPPAVSYAENTYHQDAILCPFFFNVRNEDQSIPWTRDVDPNAPPPTVAGAVTHGGAHPPLGSFVVFER